MAEMIVREATMEDYPQVMEINIEDSYRAFDYLCSLYKVWLEDPRCTSTVGIVNGEVVAYGVFMTIYKDNNQVFLGMGARVKLEWRGKGLHHKRHQAALEIHRKKWPDAVGIIESRRFWPYVVEQLSQDPSLLLFEWYFQYHKLKFAHVMDHFMTPVDEFKEELAATSLVGDNKALSHLNDDITYHRVFKSETIVSHAYWGVYTKLDFPRLVRDASSIVQTSADNGDITAMSFCYSLKYWPDLPGNVIYFYGDDSCTRRTAKAHIKRHLETNAKDFNPEDHFALGWHAASKERYEYFHKDLSSLGEAILDGKACVMWEEKPSSE